MPAKFKYVPHPHVEARKKLRPAKADQTLTDITPKTLNDKIGFTITKGVGTMWAAYLFFALTLVSLPAVLIKGDPILIVGWVAQTFLQLVLLPIIIVGQNIQAAAAEKRAILTYEDAAAVLEEANQIQKHLDHQDKALLNLIDRIDSLETKLKKK
ncbi:MAG: hypothetical protein ACKOFA_06730 [Rhodoluna sp.]